MAIDTLQSRIRKTKNPAVVMFVASSDRVPRHLLEGRSFPEAYGIFCRDILSGLKGMIPGVRFDMSGFLLLGSQGTELLTGLMKEARQMGYYVLADLPEMLSPAAAQNAAGLLSENDLWSFDGLVVSPYLGTDILKPFADLCKKDQKDLFVVLRTSNKSAAEIQDLITGARLVHMAAADHVNRMGQGMIEKCGYSQVAAVAAAGAADSLKNLRSKYKQTFLLVDGYDYPNGNAKNCSLAFDKLGHGAAVCVERSVTGAWDEDGEASADYVHAAVEAVSRVKRNLGRYLTVL